MNFNNADVQAGLSALPEYVTLLTESQLGLLVERLSDERYSYLLEVLVLVYLLYLLLPYCTVLGYISSCFYESC